MHWQLATGAPGSLSADTGDTVRYLPPAGALAVPAAVAITASGDGGASATMTLAVTPDPGTPGLYAMAWRTTTDPTMFQPVGVAADLAGNVYVELLITNQSPSRRGAPSLVKIAPDGSIMVLIGMVDGAGSWFGQPDTLNNANRLYWASNMVLDRAGNLYFSTMPGGFGIGVGQQASSGPAILKITPAGVLSVLAGSEEAQVGAMTDGTGSAARFLTPHIVGIDIDDNLYVLDTNDTPRKVTPAGVVTTLSALPTGLNSDMNGNTYAYDRTSNKLMRTGPDGISAVETSVPYCANFVPSPPLSCLDDKGLYGIRPIGGASFVGITAAGGIRRLVLRH
ncbi:hypothetical protein AB595_01540 [Massilia sp. WF1]|nr:hypothetical protein AM586_24515 [Massilia sp. WG5]KLU38566.1 hypothetical protein AB595_01540 [Massilia sp. WF1]